jgi:hypothetical protein
MSETWSVQKKSKASGMWQGVFLADDLASEEFSRELFKMCVRMHPDLSFRLCKHTSDTIIIEQLS